MADTRPRYVNPPQDLLSPVPPFVEPQGDPYAGLIQTLQNLSTQTQPVNQPGKLDIILNALAQAAAVGASDNPGAVLQQQITQRQQTAQHLKDQQFQQQQKIQDMLAQVGMQKAQDISQQRSKLAEFQRESAFRTQERQATQAFNASEERDKEQRQLNVASIKRDWDYQDLSRDYKLKKSLEQQYQQQDLDALTKFEAVKNIDERRAARDQKEVYYRMAGISAENAKALADSYITGTALTPSQSKLLDRATQFYAKRSATEFATEMDVKSAQAYHYRKAGDAAIAQKQAFDRTDRAYDETTARALANLQDESFVHMKDGTLRPYSEFGLYKQLGTLPPGADRMASTEETIQQQAKLYEAYRIDSEKRKAARGQVVPPIPGGSPALQQQPTTVPTPNAAPGAPPTANENLRMQVGTSIKQAIAGGMKPEEVNRNLDLSIKEDPANAQIYEGFKIRTATNPQAQSTPQATPTPSPTPSGTTPDAYQQKRRAQINKSNQFGGGSGSQIRKVSPEEKAILDEIEKNRSVFEKAKEEFFKRNPGSR